KTVVMKTFLKTSSLITFSVAAVSSLVLVSCGSSRDAVYTDNDGIYNSSVNKQTEQENNYYKQYFGTKAKQYENISDTEDYIFTDVEGYTSSGYVNEDGTIYEEYAGGYGGWGDNSTEVTINVYPSYNYGYYWYRPHWWYYSGWGMSFWGGYYGPSWYWCWYYPSYYYGWDWHWGHHHHHHNYYYPYYGGYDNYVVYNRGRRNTDFIYRGTGSRDFQTSGRNNYSQRETARRTNNTNYTRNNSINSRSNNIIRNSNNNSRYNSIINRDNNSRNNSNINRNNNSGRNNSNINRNNNSGRNNS